MSLTATLSVDVPGAVGTNVPFVAYCTVTNTSAVTVYQVTCSPEVFAPSGAPSYSLGAADVPQTLAAGASYQFTWGVVLFAPGTYTIAANVTDRSGDQVTPTPSSVVANGGNYYPAVFNGDVSPSIVTATGTTTARSLAARAADRSFNVKDFGAVADWAGGSTGTDNREYFALAQAAAAAAGGGIVFVPQGKYRIGTNRTGPYLTIPMLPMLSNVSFMGEGPGSLIYFDATNEGAGAAHAGFGWAGSYPDWPDKDPFLSQFPDTIIQILPVPIGSTQITATTTGAFYGVSVGDWICMCEGIPGAEPYGKWNIKRQWVKVTANASDVITIDVPLALPFTNDSGQVGAQVGFFRVIPLENAWVTKLGISGSIYWYGYGTGQSVGGGIENCYIDPAVGNVFDLFVFNDSQDFTFRDNVQTRGLSGGFNRAVRGECHGNRYLDCGVQGVFEYGEGGSFNKVHHNFFGNVNGSNPFIGGGYSFYDEFTDNYISVADTFHSGVFGHLGLGSVKFNRNIIAGAFDYCVGSGVVGFPNNYGTSETWNTEIDGNIFLCRPGQGGQIVKLHEYPQNRNCRLTNNLFIGDFAKTASGFVIGQNPVDNDHRTFTIWGNKVTTGVDPASGANLELENYADFWLPLGAGTAIGMIPSLAPIWPGGSSTSWDKGSIQFALDQTYGRLGFVYRGGTYGIIATGATTGSIAINTKVLTVASVSGLSVGMHLNIDGIAGARVVRGVNVGLLQVTLDLVASATVTGAAVTFSTTTGNISASANVLTVSSMVALAVGRYITIAGVTGVKRIISIDRTASTVTLDTDSDAHVTGGVVEFSAPIVLSDTAYATAGQQGMVKIGAGLDIKDGVLSTFPAADVIGDKGQQTGIPATTVRNDPGYGGPVPYVTKDPSAHVNIAFYGTPVTFANKFTFTGGQVVKGLRFFRDPSVMDFTTSRGVYMWRDSDHALVASSITVAEPLALGVWVDVIFDTPVTVSTGDYWLGVDYPYNVNSNASYASSGVGGGPYYLVDGGTQAGITLDTSSFAHALAAFPDSPTNDDTSLFLGGIGPLYQGAPLLDTDILMAWTGGVDGLTTVATMDAGGGFRAKRFSSAPVAPAYGTSIAVDASTGTVFTVTVTNGVGFTIANPTNPASGQLITIRLKNTSGGALGAVTWDTLYKLAGAFTSPATAYSRSVTFEYDGSVWVEISRTAADVPN